MNNILITGGAGFIGSNLALKLISKGHTVTVLDNLSKQIHGEIPETDSPLYKSIVGKVNFINGSVTSREDWLKAIKGQDILVHLAAETGTGQSMYEIQRYIDVNVAGTGILLDVLANCNHSIKRIVLSSSRAIYGEGKYNCKKHGIVYPEQRLESDMAIGDFECKCPFCKSDIELLPTSEDSKIHPSSVYGITKFNQEQYLFTVCKSLNIQAIAFRYQNVYGPGQSLKNPYTGILSIFSTQIKNGHNINIFEDGNESRDFVFIDDVVDATILGIEKIKIANDIFNVGADKPITVMQVAELLKSYYHSTIEINISGNYRLGDIRHNFADLTKIESILGFKPNWSFEKGLKAFTDWVNIQEIHADLYDNSVSELKAKGLYK